MKILVAGEYNYQIYAPALYNAFKKLGHNVERHDRTSYDYSTLLLPSKILNRIAKRFNIGFNIYRFNRDLKKKVREGNFDLVFLYRCQYVYPEIVKYISEHSVVFSYHNDDPFAGIPDDNYNKHYRNSACYCHLNYVYRKKNIEDFKAINIYNTKILLPYFLSDNNYYINTTKLFDVVFIGHYEDDGRDKVIFELLKAGVNVRLFGGINSWKRSKYFGDLKSIYGGEAFGEKYNMILNQSKICLVFISKINHDTYTRRCFELPAIKGVMLSEYTNDMLSLFPEDKCAVYFRDETDALQKVKYLLNNPDIMNSIGEKAYLRLSEIGGSEVDRAKEIINDYKQIKKTL